MPDREKVIEILNIAKTIIEEWIPMFEQYNTPAGIDDAIALLKEQEQIVRCKDCKFKIDSTSPFYKMWCTRMDFGCDADWYCADGERRENNESNSIMEKE